TYSITASALAADRRSKEQSLRQGQKLCTPSMPALPSLRWADRNPLAYSSFLISGNDFAFTETRLIATSIYSRTKQQHKNVTDAGPKLRTCSRECRLRCKAATSNPRSRKRDPECGGDHWPLGIIARDFESLTGRLAIPLCAQLGVTPPLW